LHICHLTMNLLISAEDNSIFTEICQLFSMKDIQFEQLSYFDDDLIEKCKAKLYNNEEIEFNKYIQYRTNFTKMVQLAKNFYNNDLNFAQPQQINSSSTSSMLLGPTSSTISSNSMMMMRNSNNKQEQQLQHITPANNNSSMKADVLKSYKSTVSYYYYYYNICLTFYR